MLVKNAGEYNMLVIPFSVSNYPMSGIAGFVMKLRLKAIALR
ncbi:hypothetical protein FACS189476_11860 [Spirochaetia bacterium]|nr:hypothetical protein FACS189476_11860 [Spirochaetia bacterium]